MTIEQQMTWLQLEAKCKIIKCESVADTASTLRSLTEAVSTAMDMFAVTFPLNFLLPSFSNRCPRRKTYDIEFFAATASRSGTTLQEIWRMQLEAINFVSTAVAKAVVAKYPTARKLISAYQGLTEDEGKSLLAGIIVNREKTSRAIGEVNSERIYRALMGTDPDAPFE